MARIRNAGARIKVRLVKPDYTPGPMVRGFKTCSKFFAITPQGYMVNGEFVTSWRLCVVTHIPSGASVATQIPSRCQARMIAGAVAGLGYDWGSLTVRKARNSTRKMSPEIHNWIKALARSDWDSD